MQSGVRVVGAYLEGDLRVVGDTCRVVGAYLDWDLRAVGDRCRVVASSVRVVAVAVTSRGTDCRCRGRGRSFRLEGCNCSCHRARGSSRGVLMQLGHAASRPYILPLLCHVRWQVLYRGVSVVLRPVAELTMQNILERTVGCSSVLHGCRLQPESS